LNFKTFCFNFVVSNLFILNGLDKHQERFDNRLANKQVVVITITIRLVTLKIRWITLLTHVSAFHPISIRAISLANHKEKIMKVDVSIPQILEYAQQHWFKLILLGLFLYLFTQKDFSFSINLSDPDELEAPTKEHGQKAALKKEYFTEQTKLKKGGILDHFDLSPFSRSQPKKKTRSVLEQVSPYAKEQYLKRFAKVVVEERRKFGIPSSILLASAFIQSQAGERTTAQQGNNHFAIPCTSEWAGPSKNIAGQCYRKYENAWMSFRDNSLYLSSGKFSQLQSLDSTDYQAWAVRLEQLGYSETENFAQQVIQIIEHYGLNALDVR